MFENLSVLTPYDSQIVDLGGTRHENVHLLTQENVYDVYVLGKIIIIISSMEGFVNMVKNGVSIFHFRVYDD